MLLTAWDARRPGEILRLLLTLLRGILLVGAGADVQRDEVGHGPRGTSHDCNLDFSRSRCCMDAVEPEVRSRFRRRLVIKGMPNGQGMGKHMAKATRRNNDHMPTQWTLQAAGALGAPCGKKNGT